MSAVMEMSLGSTAATYAVSSSSLIRNAFRRLFCLDELTDDYVEDKVDAFPLRRPGAADHPRRRIAINPQVIK
jgi:hypothetical protein